MSLNGLDDPAIKEAYDAVVGESGGGWLLLKYTGRDGVDLLGRGTGGIVDMRNAIAQYEEVSPLFGFLKYRRRNIAIKYVPQDCTRLMQARASVHFNSVCERLGPCDTFCIATAKELKDSELSAACFLHTASGSSSSSTSSLRRRRLMEIAEEEEEERERQRQSAEEAERERQRKAKVEDGRPKTVLSLVPPPAGLSLVSVQSGDSSNFSGEAGPSDLMDVSRPASRAKSFDHAARRTSARRSRLDLHSYSSYLYSKPRVKLGPRPTQDTAAGGEGNRRVSNLPAGLKLSKSSWRGGSPLRVDTGNLMDSMTDGDERRRTMFVPLSARPIPEDSQVDHMKPQRPHTSTGAVTTSAIPTDVPALPSPSVIPPEKLRLMKAMKLRELKKKDEVAPSSGEVVPQTPKEQPASHTLPSQPSEIKLSGAVVEREAQKHVAAHDRVSSKVDSGIDMDQISVRTRTESHPTSPVAASSDVGDSTQASSFSENTDETVLVYEPKEDQFTEVDSPVVEKTRLSDVEEKVVEEGTITGEADPAESVTMLIIKDESAVAEAAGWPSVEMDTKPATKTSKADEESKFFSTTPPLAPQMPAEKRQAPDTGNADTTGVPTTSMSTSVPDLQIPRSKFSTRDGKSPIPSATEPVVPKIGATEERSAVPVEDANEIQIRNPIQRSAVEPSDTDLGKRRSAISLEYDDALMDELQSATLQEAKPMKVSKSLPIASSSPPSPVKTAAMTAGPNETTTLERAPLPRVVRTLSTPVGAAQLLVPGTGPTTSVRAVSSNISTAFSTTELKPKNSKIGMGIADRIKALEKSTANTGSGSSSSSETLGAERPSAAFFAVRKTSTGDLSRPPSFIERTNSLTAATSTDCSRDSSPDVDRLTWGERSDSINKRLSVFEGGNLPRGRPESIQVTARIVRTPGHVYPKTPEAGFDLAEYAPLDLKQSVLVVDHLKASPSPCAEPAQSSEQAEQAAEQVSEKPAEKKLSLLQRRFSRKGAQEPQDESTATRDENREDTDADGKSPGRRSSLTIVKDFIKDRRESMMRGGSSDNVNMAPATGMTSPTFSIRSHSSSRPPSTHQNSTGFGLSRLTRSRRSSFEQQKSPSGGHPSSDGSDESDIETRAHETSANANSSNRAARFIRRLSSSLTSRNKTSPQRGITDTVTEEDAAEVEAAELPTKALEARHQRQHNPSYQPNPIVVYMGEVNIQFPDTLLWKRRFMCLDSQGFLLLSADSSLAPKSRDSSSVGRSDVQVGGHSFGSTHVRRFHMSDFHTPYTPELELQELPNSVVLDFLDGSGLQVACEDRAGQLGVLKILLDAHRNHTTFGR